MQLIRLEEINISQNRQRREFELESLNELGESIVRTGLLHPVVVREEEGRIFLVAGERRLRAISDLHDLSCGFSCNAEPVPPGKIPCITLGELDELAREEAEYEENIRRNDLTWQEQAAATARLASLRARQAKASNKPEPSVADISLEVKGSSKGYHHEDTRREILIAKHLDSPEVKGAKDLNEAWKALKRKEEADRRRLLAAEVGASYSSTSAHTLLNEDSLAWMQLTDADQFDVILTDPIYGIGADEFGDSGGAAAGPHSYADDYKTWQEHIHVLAYRGIHICKPQAHIYAFCDITRFDEFKACMTVAGWQVFRTPLIWYKPNGNRVPWVTMGPQRKYEIILFAVKGKKPVTRIYPDVLEYTADQNLGHHAQKPVALYVDLLRRSIQPGDKVLDPFAGSCPILPAADALKCKATAIEINPAAYGIGVERLKALTSTPELEGL